MSLLYRVCASREWSRLACRVLVKEAPADDAAISQCISCAALIFQFAVLFPDEAYSVRELPLAQLDLPLRRKIGGVSPFIGGVSPFIAWHVGRVHHRCRLLFLADTACEGIGSFPRLVLTVGPATGHG